MANEPVIWETEAGERMRLSEMTSDHLERCVNMIGDHPDYQAHRQLFDAEMNRRDAALREVFQKLTKLPT